MKLSLKLPETKWLVFLGGAVFLGLAIFQFLSVPPRRQQIAASENDFVAARQKREKLSEILSEAKMIESNLEVMRWALPVEDDVPALITQLERVAKQSGVGVQHLGFGGGKAETEEAELGGGAQTIFLTAVVDGSYGALQTFFRNLENTSRVVNVTTFRFSPAQKKEEGAGLSITLGLEAFYFSETEGVSAEVPLTLDTTSKDYIELIRKVKALQVYRSEITE